MKVTKDSLSIVEKRVALAYAIGQEDVILGRYGLMGYILDKMTDEDVRDYALDENGEPTDEYGYDVEKVMAIEKEFFDNKNLKGAYDEVYNDFKLQLEKNISDTFVTAIENLAQSLGNINTDELTTQFEKLMVDMSKVEK
jgi:hypothetical protein